MYTYEQARDIVAANLGPEWDDSAGTFHVATQGYEDPMGYLVPVGAREFLVDGDESKALVNDLAVFVSRWTGEMFLESASEWRERIAEMDPTPAS